MQSTVNDSRHGDVVLVYPGRYKENIEFIDCNISLVSLYSTNAQQQYIENTIIDGNISSCIRVVNGETFMINGFTLVNNEDGGYISPNYAGGGLYVRDNSHVIVINCIIRNCFALAGGGISITANASLTMSNVKIFDNIAIQAGGGLSFQLANNLSIDTVHPSSIYNNYTSLRYGFQYLLYN
ncbi:MAG: right-handed parallel beta-helix repeat-containing protein [Candidatus Cloacimonadaceae bacterium]